MTAPAFTPGPWRTEIDNVFAGPDDYRSIYVADCAPLGGPVDGTPVQIANANLIAAAPELYAIVDEWLTLGNNLAARKAIRERARAVLFKIDRGEQGQ